MDKSTFVNIDSIKDIWNIKTDGFFRQKVSDQMLMDDMPEYSVQDIFNNAIKILNNCPNPNVKGSDGKTGIIIGKVQSGKTSNFIALLALAFDNNYDISIVLGGNKNNLLSQNKTRIEKAFNVDAEKLVVLTTRDNKSLINPEQIEKFILNGRKIIIVGLKHPKHIDKITEIFKNSGLTNKATIIIDDEGDQATLNTKVNIDAMSATYQSAVNLKEHLKKHCFLSITATPQANILIKTVDLLSPDFGELVYPGDLYCGLPEFHGEDQDLYIKEIPSNEISLLDSDYIPESIKEALGLFFIGGAVRRYRGDKRNHAMLIHPSQKKFDHKQVLDKLNLLMNNWQTIARSKLDDEEDTSYKKLGKILSIAYNSFKKDSVKMPDYNILEPIALDIIVKCSPVHLCNSDEDASENARWFDTNIFVGGNMVERGITIKGLAVTYITRRAQGISNVDNTEQRARWFGYKKDYLDVCRVFMTRSIKKDFSCILEHDEDLWSSIERAQLKGLSFKQIPRIFVLANKLLRLTRPSVAKTFKLDYAEWKTQAFYEPNLEISNYNKVLLSQIKSQHLDQIETLNYNGANKHVLIKDINYDWLLTSVLSKYKFSNTENIDYTFFNNIGEAIKKCKLPSLIDIMWVRDEMHETRKVNEDMNIDQLFQGRNPNKNSPTYYKGDRSMVDDRSENLQLQIHFVKPSNFNSPNHYSPIMALYIPLNYSDTFSKLIMGDIK